MARRPDYGIDAPKTIRRLVAAIALAIAAAVLLAAVGGPAFLIALLVLVTLGCTAMLAVRIYSSKVAKLRERDRILDLAELEGDEVLLDVGCGRGLLLVEAATRLPAGEAVGVDPWRSSDLSANTPAGPLHNARLARVKVRVETGDARSLPFDDDTFHVVVSSFVLRHLGGPGERREALREIHRVLKPLGRLVLVDHAHTEEYVSALRGVGWRDVERSERLWRMYPPFRYVVGTKPPR